MNGLKYPSKEKVDNSMAYELRCIQYTNSRERGNSYDVSHGGGRLSYICRKLLMEAAVLTLHQVILMMLLIAVGIACVRLKWFSDEVAQALSRFLASDQCIQPGL